MTDVLSMFLVPGLDARTFDRYYRVPCCRLTHQPSGPAVSTPLRGGATRQRHSVLADHRRQAGGHRPPRPYPGRPVLSVLLSGSCVVAGRGRGSEKVGPSGLRGRRPLRVVPDQPHRGFLSRQKEESVAGSNMLALRKCVSLVPTIRTT